MKVLLPSRHAGFLARKATDTELEKWLDRSRFGKRERTDSKSAFGQPGKVLAEWSSRELKFPKALQAPEGSAVPGVTLLPARTMLFAPYEKLVYAVGLVLGALFWVWLVRFFWRFFAA